MTTKPTTNPRATNPRATNLRATKTKLEEKIRIHSFGVFAGSHESVKKSRLSAFLMKGKMIILASLLCFYYTDIALLINRSW